MLCNFAFCSPSWGPEQWGEVGLENVIQVRLSDVRRKMFRGEANKADSFDSLRFVPEQWFGYAQLRVQKDRFGPNRCDRFGFAQSYAINVVGKLVFAIFSLTSGKNVNKTEDEIDK